MASLIHNFIEEQLKEYRERYPDAIIRDIEFNKDDSGQYVMTIVASHPRTKELPHE